jgi:RNA polymerase primary sigma factor
MTENASTMSGAAPRPDSLAQYLREIGRHPLLTPTEEVRLAKRIERGDQRAKNRMIEANLRLVVSVARSYAHHAVPLLDLIQEGTLGLIRATEGFDWRRGTKFSTYAMWWIRQAVDRAVCNQADPIRVPIHVHERRRRLARVERSLEQELTRQPSISELASAADLSPEHTEQALGSRYGFTPVDAAGTDAANVDDPQAADAYERVDLRLTVTPLEQLLPLLPPGQRRVIELRFGIGRDECSREQASALLNLPRREVRTLERKALCRLRELTSPVELRPEA